MALFAVMPVRKFGPRPPDFERDYRFVLVDRVSDSGARFWSGAKKYQTAEMLDFVQVGADLLTLNTLRHINAYRNARGMVDP